VDSAVMPCFWQAAFVARCQVTGAARARQIWRYPLPRETHSSYERARIVALSSLRISRRSAQASEWTETKNAGTVALRTGWTAQWE